MELSVVIPVHNEQENLHGLIQEIDDCLSGQLDYEIIVVDDGSSDGTPGALQEMQPSFPGLRVIRHQVNCGQSAAIWTGVKSARAPWIATLDGDGQNDPADILRLYHLVTDSPEFQHVEAVMGHRRRRRDSAWKRLASRVANSVRRRLMKDNDPDTGCGLKVFSKQKFLLLPYFDHMHRFLTALFEREGVQVRSVAVRHRPRVKGVSHYGVGNRLWVGIVDLMGVLWLQRRNKRPVIDKED
ncbi:MAG: glycosyltransferase family 2 protein [Gammaproteobacteria bacterium]